jgi:hypothetical protein
MEHYFSNRMLSGVKISIYTEGNTSLYKDIAKILLQLSGGVAERTEL